MPRVVPKRAEVGQWLCAGTATCTVFSIAVYEMLGYPRDAPELAGALFEHVIHPEDRPALLVLREAMQREQFGEHVFECRLRVAAGGWMHVRLTCLVWNGPLGVTAGGTVEQLTSNDATWNVALAPGAGRMFDTLHVPVLVFESDGAVGYANRAALWLVGWAGGGSEADAGCGSALIQYLATEVLHALRLQPDIVFETHCKDRPLLCHAIALVGNDGNRTGAVVFCHDISAIRDAAERRLAAEQELTRTLVKEVHHRIKNNLQATVGLLRRHILEHDQSAAVLGKGISQLLSIAAVHGIQARVSDDRIYLCSVVEEIVRAARNTSDLPIEAQPAMRMFTLEPRHAVPIALVLNELVTNAIKHTEGVNDGRIVIAIEPDADAALVTIRNEPARLPPEFDLEAGSALGSGLRLVRSLLPYRLATLRMAEEARGVFAALRLREPIAVRAAAAALAVCEET